jgi:hypothetical protein
LKSPFAFRLCKAYAAWTVVVVVVVAAAAVVVVAAEAAGVAAVVVAAVAVARAGTELRADIVLPAGLITPTAISVMAEWLVIRKEASKEFRGAVVAAVEWVVAVAGVAEAPAETELRVAAKTPAGLTTQQA